MEKQEAADAILVALEKIACLFDRCTVYELLYRNDETQSSGNLEKSTLRLYTAILNYLAKAIERSKGDFSSARLCCAAANGLSENFFKAVFTTKDIPGLFRVVEDLEETVGHDADAAGAQCITYSTILRK